jgi:hypothetical protein
VIFYLLQLRKWSAILKQLHFEASVTRTGDQVGVDDALLPNVVNVPVRLPVFRVNRFEISKVDF